MTHRNTNIFFGCLLLGLLIYDWKESVPTYIYIILILIYSLVIFWGTVNLSANFFGPSKCKGQSSSQSVAITFDDGPDSQNTQRILDVLKKLNIPATFFCIGKNVKDHPEIIRQINEGGHIIGNHSFHHGLFFDLQPRWRMVNEINNTNAIIDEVIGKKPRFFRPPYGVNNPMLASAIKKTGVVSVGWSIRSFDTVTQDRNKLLERVTKNLSGGAVILFHDRCALTAEILPDLISLIAKAGLKVESLDKVLEEKAYA